VFIISFAPYIQKIICKTKDIDLQKISDTSSVKDEKVQDESKIMGSGGNDSQKAPLRINPR
jgi:hypothetical protein